MEKDYSEKDGGAEAPETPETEQTVGTEEDTASEDAGDALIRKRKKRAIIFLVLVLAAFAIVLPLLMIDFEGIRNDLLGIGKNNKIYYSAPDYSDIWENGRYLDRAGQMYVTVGTTSEKITYSFYDRESAAKAFSSVGEQGNGASVLGRYFTYLINGVTKEESGEFAKLFSKNWSGKIPTRFCQQKLLNIYLTYKGKSEDDIYNWEVRFEVLDNDGTVVNYFDRKDNGGAMFRLEESAGEYKIAAIDTVYYM